MKMTRFQARYVQWLTLIGCSLRATAGNYYGRYNDDGTNKNQPNSYESVGGNSLDGADLRREAISVLLAAGIEPYFNDMADELPEDMEYKEWRITQKAPRISQSFITFAFSVLATEIIVNPRTIIPKDTRKLLFLKNESIKGVVVVAPSYQLAHMDLPLYEHVKFAEQVERLRAKCEGLYNPENSTYHDIHQDKMYKISPIPCR
jgi:hypothetical protein